MVPQSSADLLLSRTIPLLHILDILWLPYWMFWRSCELRMGELWGWRVREVQIIWGERVKLITFNSSEIVPVYRNLLYLPMWAHLAYPPCASCQHSVSFFNASCQNRAYGQSCSDEWGGWCGSFCDRDQNHHVYWRIKSDIVFVDYLF